MQLLLSLLLLLLLQLSCNKTTGLCTALSDRQDGTACKSPKAMLAQCQGSKIQSNFGNKSML
jgi:hypothetical protein